VHDRIAPADGCSTRSRVEQRAVDCLVGARDAGAMDERTHTPAVFSQMLDDPPAERAGRAGDEYGPNQGAPRNR
jgi:hypothetical protein